MKKYLKKLSSSLLSLLAMGSLAIAASSCTAVFDDEGDCDPKYYVRFVFDMNMEYADAFKEQVKSVEVWVFDRESQQLVDHVARAGEVLTEENFMVPIDVNPGDYHVVAWCNLSGNRHFKVSDGVTHLSHPTVRMERKHDAKSRPTSDEQLDELFHGIIDITAPDINEMQGIVHAGDQLPAQTERYGTQTVYNPVCLWDEKEEKYKVIYTVSLIRNTNNIVLSLEHLSGEFNLDQIGIEMTDNNGTMLHDNRVDASDEMITFMPWRLATGTLEQGDATKGFDINDDENADGHYANFLTSELSTARMTTDHSTTIRIYYKDTDQTVFQIPVNDWISQLRSAKYHSMDEQEYLDRENNFELMVFLQDDGRGGWTAVSVVINGWHIIDNGTADL